MGREVPINLRLSINRQLVRKGVSEQKADVVVAGVLEAVVFEASVFLSDYLIQRKKTQLREYVEALERANGIPASGWRKLGSELVMARVELVGNVVSAVFVSPKQKYYHAISHFLEKLKSEFKKWMVAVFNKTRMMVEGTEQKCLVMLGRPGLEERVQESWDYPEDCHFTFVPVSKSNRRPEALHFFFLSLIVSISFSLPKQYNYICLCKIVSA